MKIVKMKIYLRISLVCNDRFDVNENQADFNCTQLWKKCVAVWFLRKAIIRLQTLNTDH